MTKTNKTSKTFYSVDYKMWGNPFLHTAWFDSKEEAKEFSSKDFRDDPVAHRFTNPKSIAEHQELVAMQKGDGEEW